MNKSIIKKIVYFGLLHSGIIPFNDAANYLGISKEYLFKLSISGLIESFNGERQYYYKNDLNNWIKGYKIINPYYNPVNNCLYGRDN